LSSPDFPVCSTNKADRHDITEILLKVALNIIKQTNKQNVNNLLKYITNKLEKIEVCPFPASVEYLKRLIVFLQLQKNSGVSLPSFHRIL
jgi:hypothetical protein